MGHACQILTFKETTNKKTIAAECTEWGDRNVDPWEHGGNCDCGGISPYYTNRIFDTYEEAAEYLEGTFGNYRQTAVKFKKPINAKISKTTINAKEKYNKVAKEFNDLKNKIHYKGIKSKTVKCKHCGAVLPTEYCGKSWYNTCLVCKHDLRPETVLNKIKTLEAKKNAAEEVYKNKEKQDKQKAKQEIYWAVACEVHC